MPNLKIYVDQTLFSDMETALREALGPMRAMLCDRLKVDIPACQFAVLPVMAMADLPRVNAEVLILPKPERSREVVLAVAETLRDMLTRATGTHVAVRIGHLDPETYIALK